MGSRKKFTTKEEALEAVKAEAVRLGISLDAFMREEYCRNPVLYAAMRFMVDSGLADESGKVDLKENRHRREDYMGQITPEIYAKALDIRGDDETCWDEKLPLVNPRMMFGPEFPEEVLCDLIIEIWESAIAQASEDKVLLRSVSLFLQEVPNSNDGTITWK